MMDLWKLDIDALNSLYENEKEQLNRSLLSGKAWEETTEQRKKIAQLSTIIYKKLNPQFFSDPSESPDRKR